MDKILKIQSEIGVLVKTETNPFYKSKYMDINGLLEQLLPLLERHKVVVSQPLGVHDGKNTLETIVVDAENNETLAHGMIYLPDIQDPQKMGSAITYYRRYSLQSLFLLRAEDDDANNASGNVKKPEAKNVDEFMKDLQPTDEEVIQWQELLESSTTAKEARDNWKRIPPMVQEKLVRVKEEVKAKLK